MRAPLFFLLLLFCVPLRAQDPADRVCPRPLPGATVQAPPELHSQNGVLETTLHLRSAFDARHLQRFCYVTDAGLISPTLRVHPGDTLLIHFRNELTSDIQQQTGIPQAEHPHGDMPMPASPESRTQPAAIPPQTLPSRTDPADAPCFANGMSARGSNLHFHGLGVAPVCHQDDVLHTLVLSGQSFDYRVHIPADESPGLFWYHPHGHGYSEAQVLGGASGAIIVEAATEADVPERTLVLRDALVTEGTAEAHKADSNLPTWDLSLNFVPVLYPADTPARLELPAGRRELWRIANAGADLHYDLEYLVDDKPQPFTVRALDGIPLRDEQGSPRTVTTTHLLLPPGARAEAVVTTPPAGAHAELRTGRVDTGPDGETEPPRRLAVLVAGSVAEPTHADGKAVVVNGPPKSSAEPTHADGKAVVMNGPPGGQAVHSTAATPKTSVILPGAKPTIAVISAGAKPTTAVISTGAKRSGETPVLAPAHLTGMDQNPAPDTPRYQRKLFFSERATLPDSKEGYVQFFLTVEGRQPRQYEMGQPPDITVHQGAVEQWTIENRARELHVFHIHQLHFRVIAVNGGPTHDNALHDTVPVPYWTGTGPYPSVTVELDFRSRAIIGSFVYHCHILGHEDAGMMGGIEVLPHGSPSTVTLVPAEKGWVVHVASSGLSTAPKGTVQLQFQGQFVMEVPLENGQAFLPTALPHHSGRVSVLYSGDRVTDPSVLDLE